MNQHEIRARAILSAMDEPPRLGAEIGVNFGRTAGMLSRLAPDLRLFLVDSWSGDADREYRESGDPLAVRGGERAEEARREAMSVTARYGHQIVRDDFVRAARHVDDGSLDFVFLDADHSYRGTMRQLIYWEPKVRPGGLVCGHDYVDMRDYRVVEAVDDWAVVRDVPIEVLDQTVWAYRKPG